MSRRSLPSNPTLKRDAPEAARPLASRYLSQETFAIHISSELAPLHTIRPALPARDGCGRGRPDIASIISAERGRNCGGVFLNAKVH